MSSSYWIFYLMQLKPQKERSFLRIGNFDSVISAIAVGSVPHFGTELKKNRDSVIILVTLE